MSDKDQIKDLFSEKLGNFEAKVNPELWTNIASQVGSAATTTAAAGTSLLTKVIIGVSGAAVLTTGVVLYTNSDNEKTTKTQKEISVVTEEETSDEKQSEREVAISVIPSDNSSDAQNEISTISENSTPVETEVSVANQQNSENATSSGFKPSGGQLTAIIDTQNSENSVNQNSETPPSNTSANSSSNETPSMKVDPKENLIAEDDPVNQKEEDVTNEVDEVVDSKPFELENLTNIFTPDGDGYNDEFFLELPELKSFQIVIMDQNGQSVFESNDPKFRWNGTNMRTGSRVLKGIHTYMVIAESIDGQVAKTTEFLMVNF